MEYSEPQSQGNVETQKERPARSTKTFSITKRDFDKAVKRPWDGKTCLVAQAMIRNDIPIRDALTPCEVSGVSKERCAFGTYFDLPGDEKKPAMRRLRASLPVRGTWKAPSVQEGNEKV